MARRETKTKEKQREEAKDTEVQQDSVKVNGKADHVDSAVTDDLLAEIDDLLAETGIDGEESARDWVHAFVQKGGQ